MIEFLTANWLWIVFIAGFVALHRGGGGCGSHGHANHGSGARDDRTVAGRRDDHADHR